MQVHDVVVHVLKGLNLLYIINRAFLAEGGSHVFHRWCTHPLLSPLQPLSPEALLEELKLIKNKDRLVLKHKSKAPLPLASTSDHTSDDLDCQSSSFTLSPTSPPYHPRQNSPILLRHSIDLSTSSTTGTEAAQDSEDFAPLDINHCGSASPTDSDDSGHSHVMERDILMTPVEHKEDSDSNSDSSMSSGELVRSPSMIALWPESNDNDEGSAEEQSMEEESGRKSDPSGTRGARNFYHLCTQVKSTGRLSTHIHPPLTAGGVAWSLMTLWCLVWCDYLYVSPHSISLSPSSSPFPTVCTCTPRPSPSLSLSLAVFHKLQGTWLHRLRATPSLLNIFILFL